MADKTAHDEVRERQQQQLDKRYSSHARKPERPEILESDPPEVRRSKKRYPSHHQQ